MKKAVVIIVLVLCTLGLVFFMQERQERRVEAPEFLPADVLFYAEQHDFTENTRAFLNSRLGRTLRRLDYRGIAEGLGSPEEFILEAEGFWAKVDETLNDPALDELFGKQFSIALFPARSFSTANPVKAFEERLIFIARPRHQAEMLQMLAPMLSKDVEQKKVQYGTHTITRYRVNEQYTLSTVTVKGLVLAAFDERLVRKSIDFYDDGENTLSDNAEFRRLQKNFKSASLFSYLSVPALYEQGRMVAESLHGEQKNEFLVLLDQWKGWGGAAYGAWREKGLVRDRVELLYSRETIDPHVAGLFAVEPARNTTLSMVPDDTLVYYWTNTLNLPLIWEIYANTVVEKQPGALDLLRGELRDSAGVELEELLAMVDKEFAIIVKDVDREGIPLPKVGGLVQLKDAGAFMEIFSKLLAYADIPVSQKSFKGHDITYWGIAPQHGLQPAFCLFGDYLLIANSTDLVKQVAELVNGTGKSLLDGATMAKVGAELNQDNNSSAYVHIAHLADSLKDLATWAESMAVLQGPDAAREAEIYLNQILLPLLDGIAMYTQLGSRSVINGDSIVLESTIKVVQ